MLSHVSRFTFKMSAMNLSNFPLGNYNSRQSMFCKDYIFSRKTSRNT